MFNPPLINRKFIMTSPEMVLIVLLMLGTTKFSKVDDQVAPDL